MHRLLLALALVLNLAHADTFVVCVGVEKYDDEHISALRYAVGDAKAVATAFRNSGVPYRNVTLLTSDETDPSRRSTRANLLRTLGQIREQTTAEDRLVLFFAGHGLEQAGEQFLLTADTQRSLLADTALPMSLVNRALSGLQAGEVLFLLDACRNDPAAGRADADAQLSEAQARGLRPVLVAAAGAKPRVAATLLACGVGQRAYEEPVAQHGVFTVALLKGFSGAAADAEGVVRLNALAQFVQKSVGDWCRKVGKRQVPALLSDAGADMVVLVRPGEPVVSVQAANEPLAKVMARLGEESGTQIVLGYGVDGGIPLSGRLERLPLSRVLAVLTAAYGLRVHHDGEIYVIERAAGAKAPAVGSQPTGDTLVVSAAGDGQYRRIGDALKRVTSGGRVLVRPGVYPEALTIKRPVTIQADGPEGEVVLAAREGSALRFECETAAVVGLTVLQRRVGDGEGTVMPAVELRRGKVDLTNCEITGGKPAVAANFADTRLTLTECSVSGSANDGLQVTQGAEAVLLRCYLRANAWYGAKVTDAKTTFTDCWLLNNGCDGAWFSRSTGELVRCRLVGNRGAGLLCLDKSTVTATECQVLRNDGWGLHCNSGQLACTKCEIAENGSDGITACGDKGLLTVNACRLKANSTGVITWDRAQASITDSLLTENRWHGLSARGQSLLTASQCTISKHNGLGVELLDNGRMSLDRCALLENHEAYKANPGTSFQQQGCRIQP